MAHRLNGSGSVLGSYCFDSYGTRQSTDNSTDPYSGYGAQWGYYRDSETGLSLLGERYYDPGQGRFLNRDPIRYRGGINLYGYAGNNPLVWIDPKGLEEIPPEDNEEIITPEEEPQIAYGIDEPENSPAQPPKSGSINCPDLGSAGGVDFSGAPSSSDFGSGGDSPDYDAVPIYVDPNKYPASAQHIIDAQAAGHPNFLTINRGGAAANRAASLSGIKTAPGMDRDEYPPAVFKEGGPGADVRLIPSGDNRGSGASFGGQIRNLPDDTIIQIIPQAPPLP